MWKSFMGGLWLLRVNVPVTRPQLRALGRALAPGDSVDRSAPRPFGTLIPSTPGAPHSTPHTLHANPEQQAPSLSASLCRP